jgi:hypothetical protein
MKPVEKAVNKAAFRQTESGFRPWRLLTARMIPKMSGD